MKLFFIGDVVGKPGRKILSDNLKRIREEMHIDVVICNGENSAGGNGITRNMADDLFRAGVDIITLGDHLWDQRCFETEIDSISNICRPANIPDKNPGKGFVVAEIGNVKLGVLNLLGQTLVKLKADCPFACADKMLKKMKKLCDIVFVDFHAETSSEKMSMGWHLDGRVQAVVGTHTHIPTSDARILTNGTAYLSDAGMTGPWDSCLGRDKNAVLQKFLDGRPRAFGMADGESRICGCIIDIDVKTKRALCIENYIYPPMRNKITAEEAMAMCKKPRSQNRAKKAELTEKNSVEKK